MKASIFICCSIAMFHFLMGGPSNVANKIISKVTIKHILQDSVLDVRALEIIPGKAVCVFLTATGQFGGVSVKKDGSEQVHYPININTDSIRYNFRALGATKHRGVGVSIGNPAYFVDIDASNNSVNKVLYQEHHPNAFYDAMAFWNDEEGIAVGDPTSHCMSVVITRDGGATWDKLPCEVLPKTKEGEAAFAASDTNIAIVGDHTWVATGGKVSRILYSPDKGVTWQVYTTPIVQGKETSGMYSVDFYDALHGFAIGGDYTQPDHNAKNKIRTVDGGKTWELVAQNKNPGYRSCVQYVPNSEGKALVAVGFKGVDYSNDNGDTWQHLSDESFYTIRFLNDSMAYAAGKGHVSKLTFSP